MSIHFFKEEGKVAIKASPSPTETAASQYPAGPKSRKKLNLILPASISSISEHSVVSKVETEDIKPGLAITKTLSSASRCIKKEARVADKQDLSFPTVLTEHFGSLTEKNYVSASEMSGPEHVPSLSPGGEIKKTETELPSSQNVSPAPKYIVPKGKDEVTASSPPELNI